MAIASNIPEDDAWIQRYRAEQAARAGRSFINGVPAEQALAGVPRSIVTNSPGVAAVTPAQADRAMVTAEQIGAQVGTVEAEERAAESQDRYDRFLLEKGIDPNRIGAATTRTPSGDRTFLQPSLEQQQAGVAAHDASNAVDARARIAARRLYGRDPAAWASISNQVAQNREARGTNNASQLNDYWQSRIMGAYPYRQNYFNSSNGYGQ